MADDKGAEKNNCPECGAEIEAGSGVCGKCGATLGENGSGKKRKKMPAPPVEPWAIRAAERFKRIPGKYKIGVPVALFIIIAIIVALSVLAGMHSPSSVVNRYLSLLKQGDYRGAHGLIARSGTFTTLDYFVSWQSRQVDKLGSLQDFRVMPDEGENLLFGHVVVKERVKGTPFLATLRYDRKTYDISVIAEDAGGTWPFRKYRLRLSQEPTRVIASPRGARVFIDGKFAGVATQNEFLNDALSLKELPGSVDEFVEYARDLMGTAQGAVEEFKRLALGLSRVSEDIKNVFNKFGSSGVSWNEVTGNLKRVVKAGKEFWSSLARTAVHIYWIFGGGDDGSLRADLERTQNEVNIENLPEGWHEVTVSLPGLKPVREQFYAPEDVVVDLKPTAATTDALKGALDRFYAVSADAAYTGDASALPAVADGKVLKEENERVSNLARQDIQMASELVRLKYRKAKMLSRTVGMLEVEETWNFTDYRDGDPVSVQSGVRQHVVCTLQVKDGAWKVTERKVK